jgi:hypothetical protein
MVEPPQTLALATLILLNLLLTAAALYVNVRRVLRARRRALQQLQQRQEQTLPRPPPPGPEASAREQHAQEEAHCMEISCLQCTRFGLTRYMGTYKKTKSFSNISFGNMYMLN